MADASARRGEHAVCNFAQTLRTSPLSLQAIAARAVALSEMAASVLNLIHPVGGGIHVCWTPKFVGGFSMDIKEVNSANL